MLRARTTETASYRHVTSSSSVTPIISASIAFSLCLTMLVCARPETCCNVLRTRANTQYVRGPFTGLGPRSDEHRSADIGREQPLVQRIHRALFLRSCID